MKTIYKPFGELATSIMFLYNGIVYEKTSARHALNCHTLKTQPFKPDQLVELGATPE